MIHLYTVTNKNHKLAPYLTNLIVVACPMAATALCLSNFWLLGNYYQQQLVPFEIEYYSTIHYMHAIDTHNLYCLHSVKLLDQLF